MKIYNVSTAVELEAAFQAASAGDRIELAAGDYGRIELAGRSFDTDLVITSADPKDRAFLSEKLILRDVEGVKITGFDILAEDLAPSSERGRFSVTDSQDVTITDMVLDGHIPTNEGKNPAKAGNRGAVIEGYGYEWGLSITGSENINVSDLELRDLRVALNMNNSVNVTLDGLDIHRVREGINLSEMRDVEIANSHFHDFKPWWFGKKNVHDHSDMIQYWGTNGTIGVHDLTIRNNLFEQGEDDLWTQTIFGSMAGSKGAKATDFKILDNTIVNGHLNGIALYDVNGAEISGNLILSKPEQPDNPSQIRTPAIVLIRPTDIELSDNTLLAYAGQRVIKTGDEQLQSGNVIFDDSNVVLSVKPDSPLFWKNYLDGRAAVTTDAGTLLLPVSDTSSSTLSVSYDGSTIELEGNGGESIDMDIRITRDTVLSFDFLSDQEGALHGIGFAKGNKLSQTNVFQLLGTKGWGIGDYDDLYEVGRPAHHYEISVGDYFTGDFDQIVFVLTDGSRLGADSSFSNLTLSDGKTTTQPGGSIQPPVAPPSPPETEEETSNGTGNRLRVQTDDGPVLLAVDDPASSRLTVSHNGSAVALNGNGGEALDMDLRITADTMLSFDFLAEQEGKIHGIGFANSDSIFRGKVFQLLGTKDWGLNAYDDRYEAGEGARHYDIAVGEHFTGDFDRIVFVMNDQADVGADSSFSNIMLTDSFAHIDIA